MVNDDTYNLSKAHKDVFLYSKLCRLEAKLDEACGTITELKKENKALKLENKKLKEENRRLISIINNNSHNSSKPPSSDQKPSKAANEYSSRQKSNRKPGAQIGHPGITLSSTQVKQKIACGDYKLIRITDRNIPNRYTIDVDISVVAYENLLATNQHVAYGNNLRSIAIDLYYEGVVSLDRTCNFLNNITKNQLSLSIGSVSNFITSFIAKAQPSLEHIKQDLLKSPIIYTDGTNVSVNGLQQYIRNQSTERSVLYNSLTKKNLAELRSNTILGEYGGMLMHDHETALYKFGTKHAECNAHLLRYLAKNTEETNNSWSSALSEFLVELNTMRKQKQAQGLQQCTIAELTEYSTHYDELLTLGIEQNKHTKTRYIKQAEKSLLNRLEKYKEPTLRFIYDFDVGFTNNMSERDLRKCKNRQKISGGFRTNAGKEAYCIVMSIIETLKRRQQNVITGITSILQDKVLFVGE